ncbi:MAG: hypothetical protein CMJ48_12825 [Planctomycetaceae bacterium]|nr:hypothetical protein [Planctomycetaceae bacterium]
MKSRESRAERNENSPIKMEVGSDVSTTDLSHTNVRNCRCRVEKHSATLHVQAYTKSPVEANEFRAIGDSDDTEICSNGLTPSGSRSANFSRKCGKLPKKQHESH